MNLAPIILFVYNRPYHTQKTVEALQKNNLAKESNFIIFSDGPKFGQEVKVEEVRKYLKAIRNFKTVKIFENKENLGLAKSIINGVTKIVNECGKVIVLEDDMVTSKHFLEYMNQGLDLYENEERVISIHGHIYPTEKKLPETFFIKGADCWGWATWKRGWDIFEPDGKKLLSEIKRMGLIKEFDFSNSFPYSRMLNAQIRGKNNSWAIRWYASAFLKNKLTLYPRESLIFNIGFDNTGTHCNSLDVFNKKMDIENIKINVSKINIEENLSAREAFIRYFETIKEPLINKIIRKIKEIFLPNKKYV